MPPTARLPARSRPTNAWRASPAASEDGRGRPPWPEDGCVPADQTPMRGPAATSASIGPASRRPRAPAPADGSHLETSGQPTMSAAPAGSPVTTRCVGRIVISVAARSKRRLKIVSYGRVLRACAAGTSLLAVLQRSLVAMVAVGEDDRFRLGQGEEPIGRPPVAAGSGCHDPESMTDTVVVDHVGHRRRRRDCVQDRPTRSVGRVVEADDRAEVGAGRSQQREPIRFRPAERPLVRQDAAAGHERLQPQAREEPALDAIARFARPSIDSARRRRATA